MYQTPLNKATTFVSNGGRDKKETKQRGILGRFRAKKKEENEKSSLPLFYGIDLYSWTRYESLSSSQSWDPFRFEFIYGFASARVHLNETSAIILFLILGWWHSCPNGSEFPYIWRAAHPTNHRSSQIARARRLQICSRRTSPSQHLPPTSESKSITCPTR